jgi:hypothetical protein
MHHWHKTMEYLSKQYLNARKIISEYESMYGCLYLVKQPNSSTWQYSLEERVFVSVEVEWNTLQKCLTADEAECLIAEFSSKVTVWRPIKVGYGNDDQFVKDSIINKKIITDRDPRITKQQKTMCEWLFMSKEDKQEAARALLDMGYLELNDRLQLVVTQKYKDLKCNL